MNRYLERLWHRLRSEPDALYARIKVGKSYREVTMIDLAGRMGAYAAAWRAAGVRKGDIVFIILRHGCDLMPAFLAAMWIGAVPSFLPFPNARQDLVLYRRSHAKVFARTGARALLAEPDLAGGFRDLLPPGSSMVVMTAPPSELMLSLPPPVETGEDAAALLQHSSGTTGLKKGVILSYRAIIEQIDAYAGTLGLTDRSCIATWLPLYHDMGLVACFLMPSVLGIPFISIDAFEWVAQPRLLLDAIEEHRATHVWMPNFAFAHIARAVPPDCHHDLSSVVVLIGCSESNRPETFDHFLARFGRCGLSATSLQTCYAMAETVFAISQSRIGASPRRLSIDVQGGSVLPGDRVLLSNGHPLPEVEVAVLVDGVPRREERRVGELCVATPFNFLGYLGDPTPRPEDGFHRTGDIGFLDGGEIFLLGRTKDLIIVNGRNLYAHDIEAAVNSVAGIHPGRCVALGVATDRTGSEEIVIIAEVEEPRPSLIAEINRAVVAHFGMPAATVKLVPRGWLHKTTSGKIDRIENFQKYLSEIWQAGKGGR